MVAIFAHRGFSGRQPEMTQAAYREAIEWAAVEGVSSWGWSVTCRSVPTSKLICLHDLTLDRTSDARGPAFARTVDELRQIDFAFGRVERPTCEQRSLVTLVEVMTAVVDARAAGVPVTLAIETKHPNPRGLDIEDRVAELLRSYGWDGPRSPVRVISFSEPAIAAIGRLLPAVERTLLIEVTLGRFAAGNLPDGVRLSARTLRW